MSRLILTRVVLGLLTLLGVSLLIFAATEVLPGDVATAVLGQGATPETVAEFRKEVGLDRPPLVRYWDWLSHAVRGDFGTALTNKRDINKTMAPKLSNTLFLALYAALIAVPLAVGLGILAAIKEGGGPTRSPTSSHWAQSRCPNSSSASSSSSSWPCIYDGFRPWRPSSTACISAR